MFYQNARLFIDKVIRTRTRLIQSGESRINKSWAIDRMDHIKRYLNFYGYKKNEDFAVFWQRHRAAIIELMPGGNSKSAETFKAEFLQLDMEHQMHLPAKREYA